MWRFVLMLIALAPNTAVAACAKNEFCPSDIGNSIALVYNYAIEILGLAVFSMLVLAGISYMLPSQIKPALLSKPNKLIIDAFVGALIILSAVIILSAINPDLVKKASTNSSGSQQSSTSSSSSGSSTPSAPGAPDTVPASEMSSSTEDSSGLEPGGGSFGGGGAPGSW
jgi:uncharacterized membrane protein YgcG